MKRADKILNKRLRRHDERYAKHLRSNKDYHLWSIDKAKAYFREAEVRAWREKCRARCERRGRTFREYP